MGESHAHTSHQHVETATLPRRILLSVLALIAVGALVGLLVLWPDDDPPRAEYAAEGVSFPEAEVVKVHEPCPVIVIDPAAPPEETPRFPEKCDQLTVDLGGEEKTVPAQPGVTESGLEPGDRVTLVEIPDATGQGSDVYAYFGTVREIPVGLMLGIFVLVVLAVARLRGARALVGLAVAGLVVAVFMIPALLNGESGIAVALVGSTAIMFVVLYLAHGLSLRTSAALAGTLFGVGVMAALAAVSVGATRLSGLGDGSGELVRGYVPDLDFRGLLVCAIIVAGLGILNDVTITQSSAVWELRAASTTMSRRELYRSGMRIGRDHIASTIYTIVFVYAGTALLTLMLASLYDLSLLERLLDERFAEEVVMTLTSAIGLVLAVPATTAIAVLTVSGPQSSGR